MEESGIDDCGGKVYETVDGKSYYGYFMFPYFPYTIRCLTGTVKSISGIMHVPTKTDTGTYDCEGGC